MKVVITQVRAIKPQILRISLYTIVEGDEVVVRDYELTILVNDFANTVDPQNVEIDLDALSLNLSKQIADLQLTANLAAAIESADLAWEININEQLTAQEQETPKSVQGMSLAYGDNDETS